MNFFFKEEIIFFYYLLLIDLIDSLFIIFFTNISSFLCSSFHQKIKFIFLREIFFFFAWQLQFFCNLYFCPLIVALRRSSSLHIMITVCLFFFAIFPFKFLLVMQLAPKKTYKIQKFMTFARVSTRNSPDYA